MPQAMFKKVPDRVCDDKYPSVGELTSIAVQEENLWRTVDGLSCYYF